MTRLLNTPIIGPSAAIVDSSWIDMLAGLVPIGIRKTPPGFCAKAGSLAHRPARTPPAIAKLRRFARICFHPFAARFRALSGVIFDASRLLVEPDVVEAPAVVGAVAHERQPFGPDRLPVEASLHLAIAIAENYRSLHTGEARRAALPGLREALRPSRRFLPCKATSGCATLKQTGVGSHLAPHAAQLRLDVDADWRLQSGSSLARVP